MNAYAKLKNEINNKFENSPPSKWDLDSLIVYWWAVEETVGKENITAQFEAIARALNASLENVKSAYINRELCNIEKASSSMWHAPNINDKNVVSKLPMIAKSTNVSIQHVKDIWRKIVTEIAIVAAEEREAAVAELHEE